MNLPNQLTVARIAMTLVFVALMSYPHVSTYAIAYAFFTAATITDYYDGKIARERNLVTNFGKLLDPVADKVLLISAFIMLMADPYLSVPAWTVVVILTREFLVTGVRLLAASGGVVIAADRYGKTKAVIQMIYVFVFLFFALAARTLEEFVATLGRTPEGVRIAMLAIREASFWAMFIVALYTLYSGVQFARLNWQSLNVGNR